MVVVSGELPSSVPSLSFSGLKRMDDNAGPDQAQPPISIAELARRGLLDWQQRLKKDSASRTGSVEVYDGPNSSMTLGSNIEPVEY